MRRILAISAAALTLSLVALAPSQTEAAATHELNFGSLAPEGTPWAELLNRIKKQVETESSGAIEVIIRPPGVMGEVEMVRETRKGERLQAAAVTTAALAEGGNVPQLQLVELPFLFDSNKEADHVLDNVMWDDFSSVLKRRGFILGVWSENGWRSFGTKGKPVSNPGDLAGLKMRSQESDVHMAMYTAFGANAVQKPMTEVLTALQSNVVEGLDNTALYMLMGGLTEPLDYFTTTRHIYQPAAVVYSRRWFEELSPELQKVLLAPRALAAEGRVLIREEEKNMLEALSEMGMEKVELTDEQRTAYKVKARAMHAEFAATIDGGPEFLGKLQGALDAMR